MSRQINIQIISAGSILGLQSFGVETLPESLLSNGLREKLGSKEPVIQVPLLNHLRSGERDKQTHILNSKVLREFSISLQPVITKMIDDGKFSLVLGGDCSILIGILSALKSKGNYGLLFMDAHADFYEPEKSTTSEAADMDLAIVTGRGPDSLSNVDQLKPYVRDEHVIHIGQRDWEETRKYGSQDIKNTVIRCHDAATIRKEGTESIVSTVLTQMAAMDTDGFWIHFDTDVLSDDINPAVDYRIPGGLSFTEAEQFINSFLQTGRIAGISVTIFNPFMDKDGSIGRGITDCLVRSFRIFSETA
jgi:arginase